jgi:hypothetical protein
MYDPQAFVDGWNDANELDARIDTTDTYISDGPTVIIDVPRVPGHIIITTEDNDVIVGCEIDDPNNARRSGTVAEELASDTTTGTVYRLVQDTIGTLMDYAPDDDLTCDQCNATMINGVYCHETGCPNRGKVKVDGVWTTDDDGDDY